MDKKRGKEGKQGLVCQKKDKQLLKIKNKRENKLLKKSFIKYLKGINKI